MCACVYFFLPLQATEIERLLVWYNPQGAAELALTGESDIEAWLRKELLREKNAVHFAQLAWELCPAAAVFLQRRLVHNHHLNSYSYCPSFK